MRVRIDYTETSSQRVAVPMFSWGSVVGQVHC